MSLTCPRCGAIVPDGAERCPRCQAATEVTRKIDLGELTWCPSCGALVGPDATTCPKCGAVVREEPIPRPVRDLDLPEIDDGEGQDSARTGVMTRIESAIPPADGQSSSASARDRMPRPRAFAFAAAFAVAIVGGAALLITHPWDPSASVTRATEPADTSMSGFPGEVESLSGQDRVQVDDDGVSTDSFDHIESAYEQLSELAGAVGESEDALLAACEEGDASGVDDGLERARAIAIDVSNLISDASQLDDQDGTYADDLEHIQTLGNWLRNRVDALTSAWGQAADAGDPSQVADSIRATLDGAADYATLFDESYDAWRPVREE